MQLLSNFIIFLIIFWYISCYFYRIFSFLSLLIFNAALKIFMISFYSNIFRLFSLFLSLVNIIILINKIPINIFPPIINYYLLSLFFVFYQVSVCWVHNNNFIIMTVILIVIITIILPLLILLIILYFHFYFLLCYLFSFPHQT